MTKKTARFDREARRARSGWKTHQKSTKVKKKTKLALTVLSLLIGLLLASKLINFVNVLGQPLNSAENKNYKWNGEFNLNFVTGTEDISIVSYKPQDKEILVLKIPSETYLDASSDFGKWQLRSIYALGESSKIGGQALLKKSLSNFLGLPIDGYASVDLVSLFRQNLFSGFADLPKIKTDFTLGELLSLKRGLMSIRYDKIKQIDLSERLVLEKAKLADGTEVYIADPTRLDSVMVEFADPKITDEHASIAIFNATDRPNLAQRAKRIITNLGGNVIALQNAPTTLAKSYVEVGSTGVEGEDSKTLIRLKQIFDLACGNDQNCAKIPKMDLGLASARAQIIVVLGEDFP